MCAVALNAIDSRRSGALGKVATRPECFKSRRVTTAAYVEHRVARRLSNEAAAVRTIFVIR
jgi:hypothetical protein